MKNKSLKFFLLSLVPLVSISLFVTSCSNNTSTNPINSTHTLFLQYGSAQKNENLNNILPSESNMLSNQGFILSFILNDLINGKKNNLQIKDLKIITLIPNNDLGILDITYSVKNYWENNVLMILEKEITTKVDGFLKETIPTKFLDQKNKDISSNPKLSTLSTNELYTNKILLQELLFDNEISGNKESLTLNDINILNFSNDNSETGIISIQYEVIKYWSNKGIIENNNKSFSIILSGFKKVSLSAEQILKEINYGGDHNGLSIDKFYPVIAYLNLSNQTRLNTINEIEINNTLKLSPNLNDLTISIVSGNQNNKQLVLSISGSYKSIVVPSQQITINGFYNSINNYAKFSEFINSIYISELDINIDSFFNNLQTETDIKTWTTNDWMNKYLNKLVIAKIPSTTEETINFNLITYYKDKIFEDIVFSNVVESIDNKTWTNLKVNVKYSNYHYDALSKSWIKVIDDVNYKSFSFSSANHLKYYIFSEKDTIDWIAKNKVSFNLTMTSQFYASYWYSLYKNTNDLEAINAAVTIDNNYKVKYFNNGKLSLSLDYMTVADTYGQMLISYKLIYNEFLISTPTILETNTFKKLLTFVDANKTEQKNFIQVYDSATSILSKNIIKSITKEFTKQQLNDMVLDVENTMTSKPILFRGTNHYRLFNGERLIDDKLDEDYLKNINPWLFGKRISPTIIDIDKNLFMINGPRDNNNKFFINSIMINVGETTTPTVKRESNAFLYKVPFKYSLEIEGASNSLIEINSYYWMSVLYSDLGLK